MENANKSSRPIAIIGLVALAAIGLGAWFYFGSKNTPATGTGVNKAPSKTPDFANAPPGGTGWTKGSPAATVTVEEFADFQCGTCAAWHPKVNDVRSTFGDKVRIIFRHYPLQGHRWAYDAACAAEAAGVQGRFWDMQNMIFNNQQSWANSTDARSIFTGYAKTLGLNVDQFTTDMVGLPVKNKVDADMKRAQFLGINSTPAFFINNKPLSDLEQLKATVEKALQETGAVKQASPANSNNNQ